MANSLNLPYLFDTVVSLPPCAGLPGARDGPPVEGDGAARAQQDERAEPLHLLRPRPHARLRRRRLLRHARQRRLLRAGHAQHLGAHPGAQVPHRDLAQGAGVSPSVDRVEGYDTQDGEEGVREVFFERCMHGNDNQSEMTEISVQIRHPCAREIHGHGPRWYLNPF